VPQSGDLIAGKGRSGKKEMQMQNRKAGRKEGRKKFKEDAEKRRERVPLRWFWRVKAGKEGETFYVG
jgi:hypothetical protein